jgi:hypothetical protein
VSVPNLSLQNPIQPLVVNPPPPIKKGSKSRSCIIAWSCGDWIPRSHWKWISLFLPYHTNLRSIQAGLRFLYLWKFLLNLVPILLPGCQICAKYGGTEFSTSNDIPLAFFIAFAQPLMISYIWSTFLDHM